MSNKQPEIVMQYPVQSYLEIGNTRLYLRLLPKCQLAVSEARMRVTVVMVKGKLPCWLLSAAPSERFVNALMARFRLITVAVSQS